jgi:hypothetical protein
MADHPIEDKVISYGSKAEFAFSTVYNQVAQSGCPGACRFIPLRLILKCGRRALVTAPEILRAKRAIPTATSCKSTGAEQCFQGTPVCFLSHLYRRVVVSIVSLLAS